MQYDNRLVHPDGKSRGLLPWLRKANLANRGLIHLILSDYLTFKFVYLEMLKIMLEIILEIIFPPKDIVDLIRLTFRLKENLATSNPQVLFEILPNRSKIRTTKRLHSFRFMKPTR